MKPILSEIISEEQFGFLFNKQIHDVVSLTHDTIHSIKKDKQYAFSLKLDFSKAYDRVSWTFIWLILIHIGMSLDVVNWIMGYIHHAAFTFIINGSPSTFFW